MKSTQNSPSGPFYITTAIDYPNGAPHLGHAYEKTVTDSYARWYRLQGRSVYFLTGTDENGQKLVESAEKAGQSTQAYVDANVEHFRALCSKLNISYDDFIRTTEPRHAQTVQTIWKTLEAKGDIFFDQYTGQYCLACEAFYTQLQAPEGQCPEHGTALQSRHEEGYFFRTSKYQDWILGHLRANPECVVPASAMKEIQSRVAQEPIHDLSISRPNKGWGIPVPGKPEFVIYTWFDALINYYAALESRNLTSEFWPANLHVIGRDILWFHAVIWPMMLHAAGIALPRQVYVHGMVLAEDGRKMSKSLGNGVDPMAVLAQFPTDSFRYTLLRAIPSHSDGRFSLKDLAQRHQSELGNDLGNLLMRIVKLTRKRVGDVLPPPQESDICNPLDLAALHAEMADWMEKRDHSHALDRLWLAINVVNAHVNTVAPWGVKEEQAFKATAAALLHSIRGIFTLLLPFLPETARLALLCLGVSEDDQKRMDLSPRGFQLSDPPMLFPRIEPPATV